ncbi:DUF4097 family beta strand repeat-containing protein [Streptomyces sp. MST-110588]|uniref:DUF4097 family beta strand repeat-containing protein n=1 Tax=Streptomyces sp. MST-110588 TaxID=2833628 RepID=UPI001F5C9B64|nr:DUF4097 family beta strand repeat-containing protein [Streptomyces sp. MST-110588]UNO42445.1 DUF4097 family beta strand repeat protein [Streptomyces sp. MST-110588]
MTERIIPVDTSGPIALDLTMNAGSIRIAVDPALKQARVVLMTKAASGPSADAIRNTAVSLNGQYLKVRVPDVAGAMGGTTIRVGGSGVQIVGGNVYVSGNSGGKVFINGREVTATGPAGSAATPVTATVHLPAKSVALIITDIADTVVTGTLVRLEYDGVSGALAAERVGDLEVTVTSGSVIVNEVTGSLDANLTSGNLSIGAYSGNAARLNLTSGNVQMAATSQATGRLTVSVTSGRARITGTSRLNVRRRVTSGYVHIS